MNRKKLSRGLLLRQDRKRQTAKQTQNLVALGSKMGVQYTDPHPIMLEVFPAPAGEFIVQHECKEFSSLCPKTGQPDFATIAIEFEPRKLLVESKSLKLYLTAFRNQGCFMETIVNTIADDLQERINARSLVVHGYFNSRGGIETSVKARRGKG